MFANDFFPEFTAFAVEFIQLWMLLLYFNKIIKQLLLHLVFMLQLPILLQKNFNAKLINSIVNRNKVNHKIYEFNCKQDKFYCKSVELYCKRDEFNCKCDKFSCKGDELICSYMIYIFIILVNKQHEIC